MKILLTNDDGIHSRGLLALCRELRTIADVFVVAPEAEQSAVGHAITISDPLRVKEVSKDDNFYGYAVTGTPADCVKIAVKSLLDDPPDMVVSGINIGANVATNIIYSGTVSAATEGTILGFPSIAVSVDAFVDPCFGPAAKFIKEYAPFVYNKGLPPGTFLNVNVPSLPQDKIKGVVVTSMGMARFREEFQRRTDPRGHVYYWQGGEMIYDDKDNKADSNVLRQGMISVTPIHYDLTDHRFIGKLEEWNLKFETGNWKLGKAKASS